MSGYNCDYCGRNFDSDEDHLCGADLHRLYVQRDALRAEVERLRRVVEAARALLSTLPVCHPLCLSCDACEGDTLATVCAAWPGAPPEGLCDDCAAKTPLRDAERRVDLDHAVSLRALLAALDTAEVKR